SRGRLGVASIALPGAGAGVAGAGPPRAGTAALAIGLGVDRHVARQPGDQRTIGLARDRDPHGNALRHLDPITRRVLRRQNRGSGASLGADALDAPTDLDSRIG